MSRLLALLSLTLSVVSASHSWGQITPGDIDISLTQIDVGISSPVALTHAGDGSGRLFVVDQVGIVWVIDNGVRSPFLDISNKLVTLSPGFDERGLLGLAFHPNYSSNGRFFVRYSAPRDGDPSEPCNDPDGFIVACHKAVVAEYQVSLSPNIADPNSEQILFEVDEPQFNHNGGDIHFGPDGFLYFALGDGGGANDGLADVPVTHGPEGNGQNIETALGSMLRIDVDGAFPYEIPIDNPFVGGPGLDEIYAYGFRNPFRFSFDALTGELYLGDVGQNVYEEVDIVVNGGNYGWVIREGAHCFDPFDPATPPATCNTVGLIDPIAEYDHTDGISVIGGYVYRGSTFPELVGKYVFGEFSRDFGLTGRLFYIDTAGILSQIREFPLVSSDGSLARYLKGIGVDESGEIYLCLSSTLGPFGSDGIIARINAPQQFVRGELNGDSNLDLADTLIILGYLFTGGSASCHDAVDVNDDGRLNIADPLVHLAFQFLSGQAPPPPFAACGLDTTPDIAIAGDLGCGQGPGCP